MRRATTKVFRCDVCQKVGGKLALVRPELHPIPVKAPWYHFGIDFIGPISPVANSDNCYILTVSDYCTKWVEATLHLTRLPPRQPKHCSWYLSIPYKPKLLRCTIFVDCHFQTFCRKNFSNQAFEYGLQRFGKLNFCQLLKSAKTARITLLQNLGVYGIPMSY